MRFLVAVIALVGALMGFKADASAQDTERAQKLLKMSEEAKGRALPDIVFTDTEGQTVRLSDYRGKPLLVTLVYTGCVNVCPTLIENLVPAVEVASEALGSDSFAVITVGFDIRQDTPQKLKSFARTRGADMPNWKFLAADQVSLDALAHAVGFGFFSRPGGFDHFSQVSLVNAEGRLHGQVYGAVFDPPVIVEPLKNLVFRTNAPVQSLERLIDRVKYYCTVYDPRTGRYYFNHSLFIGVAIGLACLGLVFFALVREWKRASENSPGPS